MENQFLLNEICPTTTQHWIKNGAILVDVREKEEVEELAFDAPDVKHIPLTEFEERFNEIPKDKYIIMLCQVGVRSLRATAYLINHGYDPEKVVNMKLGLARWVAKGFPAKGNLTSVANQGDGCCSNSTPAATGESCCAN